MSLPITARVKRVGKKGCGCPSNCNCGKTPAKFNPDLKAAAAGGKLDDNPKFKALVENAPAKMYNSPAKMYNSPAKMGCYGKKK